MGKQILRVESIHSSQAFTAKMKHNYRIGNVKNADPAFTHRNEQLIRLPVGETYHSFFEKKIMGLPYYENHKLRKNATLGFEILLSYGIKNLPENFSIDHWKEQSKKWLEREFGRDNIASAVLHMDEGTPHIHAIVIPIKEGRLCASAFIPDRQAMRDLHLRYHTYTKECGLESENHYMIIDHTKTAMFYNNINLALERSLPGPEEEETLEDYARRANEFYQNQMLRSLGRDYRISQLEKNNQALEKANRTIERQTEQKHEKRMNEIMKRIGSVENAQHAIQYRDNLQGALAWTRQNNPELSDSVETIISNMQLNYERSRRTEHSLTPEQSEIAADT